LALDQILRTRALPEVGCLERERRRLRDDGHIDFEPTLDRGCGTGTRQSSRHRWRVDVPRHHRPARLPEPTERLLDGLCVGLSTDTPSSNALPVRGLGRHVCCHVYSDHQGFTLSGWVNSPSMGRFGCLAAGVALSLFRGNRSAVPVGAARGAGRRSVSCWTGLLSAALRAASCSGLPAWCCCAVPWRVAVSPWR
jgi:hypothetical protein